MRGEAASAYGASDIDLELTLRGELLACAAPDGQVDASGPAVRLRGRTAEVLTLAFHELATNAVKFGALSHPMGKIQIEWWFQTQAKGKTVHLAWSESGVPVVSIAPRHEGFGFELLTRGIPYELRGAGSVTLKPGGFGCVIAFPIEEAQT
jgi:two-component sensor histidine kinase